MKRGRVRQDRPLVRPVMVDVGDRNGPVPTRAGKQRMAVIAGLFHAGFSYKEIAAQTGISAWTVRRDVLAAEKHYRLSERVANVLVRRDAEAAPLAMDHLIATLESTEAERVGAKDMMAMRTLEGTGVFRSFTSESGKHAAPQTMALQVNFSAPPGRVMPTQQAQIVGASRVKAEAPPTVVPADYTD